MSEQPRRPSSPTVARLGAALLVIGFVALFVFHHDTAGLLGGVGLMVLGAVALAITLDRR